MWSAKAFATSAITITGLLVAGSVAALAVPASGETVPLRIQIIGTGGMTEGTGFLMQKTATDRGVALYFLTAGHLFDREALGERRTAVLRIRVIVDGGHVIEARGSDVVFPGGTEQGLDLAVIKATTPSTTLTPVRVSAEPLNVGDTFTLRGHQGPDEATLTEHVRFRSTRLVLGDRTVAEMSGFVGAPAVVDAGVFGIVTECSATRVPIVTLLSAARGFLSRALPGWRTKTE